MPHGPDFTTSRRTAVSRLLAGTAATATAFRLARAASANEDAAGTKTGPARDVQPTSWPSARGTPDQRGVSGSALSGSPTLKWELASPDGWVAGAAIVGEHVYAPALCGFVHCLKRETGEEVWKYRSIDDPDPKQFAPGFKATPLITETAVYLGDEDGVLHALDRTTGAKLWTFATGAEIAGCVATFEDQLLLASHDSFLYCLNTDGTEAWKFQTNDRINCSPGIVEHFTFLAGCDEHLRVIDVKSGMETLDMPLESFLIASPAIVGDLLYVGTHTGQIVCVNWRKGEFVWRYEGPRKMPFHASAAVTDDLVIVGGHDKTIHAVDRATGESKWTFATRAKVESSGVVVDRRFFVGSQDGNVYGVSLDSGMEIWKFNAGKDVDAGLAIGEGCMIVGEAEQNGRLLCFA